MIVERFEGKRVICENNDSFIEFDRSDLPQEAAEGDVLGLDENGKLFVDKEETQQRKKRIRNLMNKLFSE